MNSLITRLTFGLSLVIATSYAFANALEAEAKKEKEMNANWHWIGLNFNVFNGTDYQQSLLRENGQPLVTTVQAPATDVGGAENVSVLPGLQNTVTLDSKKEVRLGKVFYSYKSVNTFLTTVDFKIKSNTPLLPDRICKAEFTVKSKGSPTFSYLAIEESGGNKASNNDICQIEIIKNSLPSGHLTRPANFDYAAVKITILPDKRVVGKMKTDLPVVENADCFPDGAIEGYRRVPKTRGSQYGHEIRNVGGDLLRDYKKTICKGKSLTIRLPEHFSYEKMQLTFRKPVKTKGMDAAYSIEFGTGIAGPGKKDITNDSCKYVVPVFDSFQCEPIEFGNINTGDRLTSTIIIKNEGDEPFFPVFQAWSNVTE